MPNYYEIIIQVKFEEIIAKTLKKLFLFSLTHKQVECLICSCGDCSEDYAVECCVQGHESLGTGKHRTAARRGTIAVCCCASLVCMCSF